MSKLAVMITPEFNLVEMDIEDNELQQLQGAVDGLIQPVDIDPNTTMWVNEEGLLREDLEVNHLANGIYAEVFGEQPFLRGNAVFTGGTDEDGNTMALSQKHLEALKELVGAITKQLWITFLF